eukprot:scaffold16518_cov34-Attheya_sp.AAC.1
MINCIAIPDSHNEWFLLVIGNDDSIEYDPIINLCKNCSSFTCGYQNAKSVTLTASTVESAIDIGNAINEATNLGTTEGTVILDGKEGPFIPLHTGAHIDSPGNYACHHLRNTWIHH